MCGCAEFLPQDFCSVQVRKGCLDHGYSQMRIPTSLCTHHSPPDEAQGGSTQSIMLQRSLHIRMRNVMRGGRCRGTGPSITA